MWPGDEATFDCVIRCIQVTDTIQLSQVNPTAPLDKICLLGCGIPTGKYGTAVGVCCMRSCVANAVTFLISNQSNVE